VSTSRIHGSDRSGPPAALVALDVEHVELAGDVAEYDRAVAGHHNHPSIRNARSNCAVAASMSVIFLVSAAFKSSPTAYFQCGRALREALMAPTNFAASPSVASAAPGPAVGLITRVSASLKSYGMPALCTARADDSSHHRIFFLGVWAPPPRLTAPLGLVRAGLFFVAIVSYGKGPAAYYGVNS
jgi:hypothetical protein